MFSLVKHPVKLDVKRKAASLWLTPPSSLFPPEALQMKPVFTLLATNGNKAGWNASYGTLLQFLKAFRAAESLVFTKAPCPIVLKPPGQPPFGPHPASSLGRAASEAKGAVDSRQLLPQGLHFPLGHLGSLQGNEIGVSASPRGSTGLPPSTYGSRSSLRCPLHHYLVGFFEIRHNHGHFVRPVAGRERAINRLRPGSHDFAGRAGSLEGTLVGLQAVASHTPPPQHFSP